MRLFFLCLFLFVSPLSFAMDFGIGVDSDGTVTDSDGSVLDGVSVVDVYSAASIEGLSENDQAEAMARDIYREAKQQYDRNPHAGKVTFEVEDNYGNKGKVTIDFTTDRSKGFFGKITFDMPSWGIGPVSKTYRDPAYTARDMNALELQRDILSLSRARTGFEGRKVYGGIIGTNTNNAALAIGMAQAGARGAFMTDHRALVEQLDDLRKLTGSQIGVKVLYGATTAGNYKTKLRNFLDAYKASNIPTPLTNLGLKGVTMGVSDKISTSVYIVNTDTIIFSLADLDRFGVGVIDHELRHAGLNKAKKTGVISNWLYEYFRDLNRNKFSSFNGYIGKAMNRKKEFAFEEAYVFGSSYQRVKSRKGSLTDWHKKKAEEYLRFIRENNYLTDVGEGKPLHVLGTPASNPSFDEFYQAFDNPSSTLRTRQDTMMDKIQAVQNSLCIPGKIRRKTSKWCPAGQGGRYGDYQFCTHKMEWKNKSYNTCDGNYNAGGAGN